MGTAHLRTAPVILPLRLVEVLHFRGFDEFSEYRMSPVRSRFELRVILDAQIEFVTGDLHLLDK